MKLKTRFLDWLNLRCSWRNYKYSPQWDQLLNDLIDSGVTSFDDYTVTFYHNGNSYVVWVKNEFYAYGYLCVKNSERVPTRLQFMPKLSTMKRLDGLVSGLRANRNTINFSNIYGDQK